MDSPFAVLVLAWSFIGMVLMLLPVFVLALMIQEEPKVCDDK